MAHEANARSRGALEAHVQAKTDAVFDAAAAFLDAAPERARPSLCCAEKDKESATASLSPLSRWSPTLSCCTCCRAAAVLAATHAVDDHRCRSWAPAPAATTAEKSRSGAAWSGESGGPCLIRHPNALVCNRL